MFKEKEKVINRIVYTSIFYLSGIIWANRLSVTRHSLPSLDYRHLITLPSLDYHQLITLLLVILL